MPAGVLTESAAGAANKKGTVEETYQKLTQHQVRLYPCRPPHGAGACGVPHVGGAVAERLRSCHQRLLACQ